ncbi:lysophospholipid acyltransferase family protein [Actinokineospora diospyrosa]|uniref:1-acyl-sn-glycerol-3-phosphate acyltransferases n=1 Tax=Actinokineospora diospyrosa TaxID=103728 RepID=A0ABT1IJL6_9PSEU|nr:lysophospholipid acyltransferase family protein [Actinokineospora diospyrosa]MCP2272847.1 1-acyl-sn-glycerol-3-phosphate acyltransferases [Actinokineospora diospyrosa]
MSALRSPAPRPSRAQDGPAQTPPVWRAMCAIDTALVRSVGRIEITGEFPAHLRGRPVLVAVNHIGMFDPFVMIAAMREIGLLPRFMLTAGLLDAPVLGYFLRKAGHLRVDRGKANIAEAFSRATDTLTTARVPLLLYPEGRVSRDPGLWPERGKTGAARMALHGNVPVVTVSQWGAHEAVCWGTEVVNGPADVKPLVTSFFRAVRKRPVFKVHFGGEVDLADLSAGKPGDAMRAHARIMRQITDDLVALRPDELDAPKFHDPTRPCDSVSPWRP